MSLTFPTRSGVAALALAAAALLPACGGGNPTCIFVGGCGSGGAVGGTADNPAILPVDGQWILDSAPSVTDVFPSGSQVGDTSPIVIVFSESMNESTLRGAFEIRPVAAVVEPPISNVTEVLLASGRVLVLLPSSPLDEGSYIVQVVQASTGEEQNPFGGGNPVAVGTPPTDLTGQTLRESEDGSLRASFAVVRTPPNAPQVVARFPADTSIGASDTAEVVVVFDRDINASTVDDGSFEVLVERADPTEDPVASPLQVQGVAEPRVFLWQSADAAGNPVPLGSGNNVLVDLSPSPGNVIRDTNGNALPRSTSSFTTIPFATPLSAGFLSEPTDAIGIRNLTIDGDEDLAVQVDLLDAEPGDFLDLFLVGTNTNQNDPQLIALRRQTQLTGTAPIQVGHFDTATVDMTVGSNAQNPRFADGSVSFAFRMRRGTLLSPLRLLDVDLATPGVQDPYLDTTAPTVTRISIPSGAVGGGAGGADLVSDLADLVLTGVADEPLESVEVTAVEGSRTLGNGVLPPVVGSRADGAFVAAPVGFGVFDTGTATFTAVAYDRAFNASNEVTGSYTQRGHVGPTPFVPGDVLSIEVFDAVSLVPLSGALVLVHADMGDGMTFPLTSAARTTGLGTIQLATDALAVGAIVTVDVAGYDLFTYHGVSGTRLSVPLWPTSAGATSVVSGSLTSNDPAVAALLGGLDRRMDDSRLPAGSVRTYPTDSCGNFFVFLCSYGPESILPERLGVQSFFAGDFAATETTFNANQLLQAFCLEVPTGPVAAGALEDTSFELPFLLSDSSVDPEERPDELTGFTFRAGSTTGIDLADLVDAHPEATGVPQVSVETVVPGTHSTTAVGLGLAFDQGMDVWNVRSARPGAVSPTGFFGERGAVDTDLFVRVELRDGSGNVSGVRPRLSSLMAPFDLTSADVPVLTSPPPAPATTGGSAYNLTFADTIPDAAGQPGLYRARLVGPGGRGWTLWRLDPAGSGTVLLRVPDPAEGGGIGLLDGTVTCRLEVYAWPTLDGSEFLWSDVEREFDRFARSTSFAFVQGP